VGSPSLLESEIRNDSLRIETYDYRRIFSPQIYTEKVDLIVPESFRDLKANGNRLHVFVGFVFYHLEVFPATSGSIKS